MKPESQPLQVLRTLIVKSQCEPLSEPEIAQLNELIQADGGPEEAAALIDQFCALTDSGSLDSLPMAEVLSEALGNKVTGNKALGNHKTVGVHLSGADLTSRASTTQPSDHDGADSIQSARSTKAYWWLAIAASHLIVASLAWSLAKSSPSDRQTTQVVLEPSQQPESTSLRRVSASPQLVSMTACVWRPSGDSVPTLGKPLQNGELLNLVEGIADLRIGQDTPAEAMVRIEGPASVLIRANGKLGLLHGSMTVKSLGTGTGIVDVGTPMGRVLIDGQSSIGLVCSDSVSEVHVFDGQVVVRPNEMSSSTAEVQLEDGEALRLSLNSEGDFAVVKFEASEANFVSARSLGFDPLALGEEYVRAVADSQPNIYWRFEELKGESPQFVENQGSAPGMHAMVVGNPGWRQYGTNRVAELGMSTSSAFQASEPWPEKPLDDYTIELWIKPQLYHHGEVICLHDMKALEDGRYQHTMMLEATAQHYFTHRLSDSAPNRFRFVHRELGSAQPISVTSLFANQPYQPRVWQHVVAQKKGSRQLLWIGGQLSAERSNPVPLGKNVQILVGQVYPNSVYRRFVGQIDEIAIYDRCLTPQEMRAHIKAAGRSIAPKEPDASGSD